MTLKEIYGKTNFPFVEVNGSFKAIPVSISDRQKLIKSNPISLVKNQYILNELNEQNDFISKRRTNWASKRPAIWFNRSRIKNAPQKRGLIFKY